MIDKTKIIGWQERIDIALKKLAVTKDIGGIGAVQVQHDNWCNQLAGRGACNCEPNIVLVLPVGSFKIGDDGTPVEIKAKPV